MACIRCRRQLLVICVVIQASACASSFVLTRCSPCPAVARASMCPRVYARLPWDDSTAGCPEEKELASPTQSMQRRDFSFGTAKFLSKLAAGASMFLPALAETAAEMTGREQSLAREIEREKQLLAPPVATESQPVVLRTCQELNAPPGQYTQEYLSGRGYWPCVQKVVATERDFTEFTASAWLAKHPTPGMRDLVVGLDRQPYWLIAQEDPSEQGKSRIEQFALKAECTHLGCLADWEQSRRMYVCPCHGSEYDTEGRVLKGPAPRPLSLAKVEVLDNERVQMSAWIDPDFRG